MPRENAWSHRTILVDGGRREQNKWHSIIDRIGPSRLLHREGKRRYTASVEIENLTNVVALYNFLSTFSGTHFLQPRSVVGKIGLTF
jgi:hypothetical protein